MNVTIGSRESIQAAFDRLSALVREAAEAAAQVDRLKLAVLDSRQLLELRGYELMLSALKAGEDLGKNAEQREATMAIKAVQDTESMRLTAALAADQQALVQAELTDRLCRHERDVLRLFVQLETALYAMERKD